MPYLQDRDQISLPADMMDLVELPASAVIRKCYNFACVKRNCLRVVLQTLKQPDNENITVRPPTHCLYSLLQHHMQSPMPVLNAVETRNRNPLRLITGAGYLRVRIVTRLRGGRPGFGSWQRK